MTNHISLPRLGKLFLMEIRLHRKTYLMMMAIIFAVSIIKIVNNYSLIATGVMLHLFDSYTLCSTLVFIAPFVLYNFVYNPTKGLTYAMLPATSLEKVLSAWIQCVIVVPVLFYASFFFCAFLADLAGGTAGWQAHLKGKLFFEAYLRAIVMQSVVFWGAFWFKHRKAAKTILTVVLIGLGLSIILSVIVAELNKRGFFPPHTNNFSVCIVINGQCIISRSTFKTLSYFLYLIVPLLPWALAFFKFRRTQI